MKKIILINFILIIFLFTNTLFAASIPQISKLEPYQNGISTPSRISLDTNGDIFIADPRSHGIVQLNQFGDYITTIKTQKTATSVFVNPKILNSKLLINQENYIAAIDNLGNEIIQIGSGLLKNVSNFTIDNNTGNIYVADANLNTIFIFNSNGNLLSSFNSFSYKVGTRTKTGKLFLPINISIINDLEGSKLVVLDPLNTQTGIVHFFTLDGIYIKSIGNSIGLGTVGGTLNGNENLAFVYPTGFTFEYLNDKVNRMYILDSQGRIQVLDANTNTFLTSIEDSQLVAPTDIQFDSINKRLLVSNGLSNIISYGIDGGQNPKNTNIPTLNIQKTLINVSIPQAVINGFVSDNTDLIINSITNFNLIKNSNEFAINVSNLKRGENILSITAINNSKQKITIDVKIIFDPPNGFLSIDKFQNITNQSIVTLSGLTDNNSSIIISNSLNQIKPIITLNPLPSFFEKLPNGNSGLSWNTEIYLEEGENVITITSKNNFLTDSIKTISIIKDSLAPQINFANCNINTSSQIQNISGIISDEHNPKLKINNNEINLNSISSNQYSFNSSVILSNVGSNEIFFESSDTLGNISTKKCEFYFNPENPKITIISPNNFKYLDAQNSQILEIKGNTNKNCDILINNEIAQKDQYNQLFWNKIVKLNSGINEFIIIAKDEFGKTSQEILTIYYYDKNPKIDIINPKTDISTNNPNPIFSFSAFDLENNLPTVSLKINDNILEPQFVTYNSITKTFNASISFDNEKLHIIEFIAIDKSGNKSSIIRNVYFDKTAPDLTVDNIFEVYPTNLSGTFETGSTLSITDITGNIGDLKINGNKWNWKSTNEYDYKSLMISAKDIAGNVITKAININDADGFMPDVTENLTNKGQIRSKVTVQDALSVLKIILSKKEPTFEQLVHGDVGPLLNGKPNRNRKLDISDVILILKKSLGQINW